MESRSEDERITLGTEYQYRRSRWAENTVGSFYHYSGATHGRPCIFYCQFGTFWNILVINKENWNLRVTSNTSTKP